VYKRQVGVGFGETLERALVHSDLRFGTVHYWNANGVLDQNLYTFMDNIRTEYVPTRVDLNQAHPSFIELLNNDDIIHDFADQLRSMLEVVQLARYDDLKDRSLIFEGAQGLMLDQDYGYFPHVTRSNCGMKNINNIIQQIPEWGEHDIEVNYVTRAYVTRHGAGPLSLENPDLPLQHNIIDNTNVTNEWQGSLRFAAFNLNNFNSITDKDFLNYAPRTAKKMTTVTCLDQLKDEVVWVDREMTRFMSGDRVRDSAGRIFNFGSYGPTRETVVDFSVNG